MKAAQDWGTAACVTADPEAFFPDPTDRHGALFALSYCNRCPVVAECLEESFRIDARYGIWGGRTEPERHRIRAARDPHTRPAQPARALAVCGTTSGHARHRRLGENPCPACKAAQAEYNRRYYAQHRGAS